MRASLGGIGGGGGVRDGQTEKPKRPRAEEILAEKRQTCTEEGGVADEGGTLPYAETGNVRNVYSCLFDVKAFIIYNKIPLIYARVLNIQNKLMTFIIRMLSNS